MHRIIFAISFITLLAGCSPASPLPPSGQATRIETDQKTGAIRFIVDGKEQARIDKDGLQMENTFLLQPMAGPAPTSASAPK